VVATAVGGLVDTVVDGITGDLVPPRDPERLGAALAALLADDDRRAAYAAAGVRRARARYRWGRVAADTEAVYRQVLARTPVEVAR
jgi:glycosyltransferase involved in cell wall biosynthesis